MIQVLRLLQCLQSLRRSDILPNLTDYPDLTGSFPLTILERSLSRAPRSGFHPAAILRATLPRMTLDVACQRRERNDLLSNLASVEVRYNSTAAIERREALTIDADAR